VGTGWVSFGEHKVPMHSKRYRCFKKQQNCVRCGIKGRYFALEQHRDAPRPHFNLYGIRRINGRKVEVLLTKDHIYPVSKGGSNRRENFQTMCAYCNNAKGDKVTEQEKAIVSKVRQLMPHMSQMCYSEILDFLERTSKKK
jgi:5-methylcytosine-specific restriction endonuclease McrA